MSPSSSSKIPHSHEDGSIDTSSCTTLHPHVDEISPSALASRLETLNTLNSPSSSLNENTVSHTSGFSLQCPYEPNAVIRIGNSTEEFDATIIQIYKSDNELEFTNSCTMLVRIDVPPPTSSYSHQMVLKVFDWRHMNSVREDHGLDKWNETRYEALSSMAGEEQIRLRGWLEDMLPENRLNTKVVQNCVNKRTIPEKPTHMDLLAYIASYAYPVQWREYMAEGLLPDAPQIALEELFLQLFADFQAAIEDQMSQLIMKSIPGRMPTAYGLFKVVSGSKQSDYPIRALLMDEAKGFPVGQKTFVAKLTRETIALVMNELLSFQVQLWRCGLQFQDTNMHNLLLDHAQQLTVVDYGAIGFVNPDPCITDRIMVELPDRGRRFQIPRYHYHKEFDGRMETDLISNLFHSLAPLEDQEVDRFERVVQSTVTNCFPYIRDLSSTISFSVDGLTTEDSYIWVTLMLHIIYSHEEQLSREDQASLLDTLRLARRVMTTEIAKHTRPWWPQALRELVQNTTKNASDVSFLTSHALGLMPQLLAVFASEPKSSPCSLAFRLVQITLREPPGEKPTLLFRRRMNE